MSYYEFIMKSIDYIEDHLDCELSLSDCSHAAGYSEYYFHKIFKATVGLTLGEYIKKRRLTKASKLLLESDKRVFEIAFECGYNSSENFVRSFKKEHGISPMDHRKLKNSLRLHEAYQRIEKGLNELVPDIVVLPSIQVKCSVYEINFDKRLYEIPRAWNEYHKKTGSKNKDSYDYGWLDKSDHSYWIGSESGTGDNILSIPGGLYLKFVTPQADAYTFVETIHESWAYIYHYMSQNNYLQNGPYAFERYVEASRTFSEEIYIPIKGGEK